MGEQAAVMAQVRYVNAEWRDRDGFPEIGSRETRRANTSFQSVQVHDARSRLGELRLDENGFTLAQHVSNVKDYHDKNAVEQVYYPEMIALVARVTGADRVLMTQHQIRTEHPTSFNDAYARFVHCDYSVEKVEEMSLELLRKHQIEPRAGQRYAWYNTWQPFDHTVERNPLTVIDSATLPMEDVIGYHYTGGGKPSLVAAPVYNPAHRFWYFSRMRTDEVLIIKQLDSDATRAVYTPHTSFDDPTSPPDAPPRRSIETRVMCVFEGID